METIKLIFTEAELKMVIGCLEGIKNQLVRVDSENNEIAKEINAIKTKINNQLKK